MYVDLSNREISVLIGALALNSNCLTADGTCFYPNIDCSRCVHYISPEENEVLSKKIKAIPDIPNGVYMRFTRYEIANLIAIFHMVRSYFGTTDASDDMLQRFTDAYNISPLDGSTPGE